MYSINKNSYLQSRSASINPRILNRCVDLALDKLDLDFFDGEPEIFRITSEQPDIPIDNVDVTRRPLAFGRWALPKLRRELHDKDQTVVIQALSSICDLVHDPEKGYEALNLRIPDRLADLLLDSLSPIRERAVLALSILARLGDGKEAIIKNHTLVDNLKYCLGDAQPSVRMKTATCIETIATSWMAADVLVDQEFIEMLLEYISVVDDEMREIEEIIEIHLNSLRYLMYDCGKCVALKNDGFKIFMRLLDHENSRIIKRALDCLMILTSTKQGKKIARKKNLLKTLNKFIHYGDTDICTSATSVIMFCTVDTKAKLQAAEIKSLPRRLVKLCGSFINSNLQTFALKALTNICEHKPIRKLICERHLQELENLQVIEENKIYKDILLKTVSWLPEQMH